MAAVKQKILLLYLKTGGGHFSSAKAIEAELKHKYHDADVKLIDGLSESLTIARAFVEGGYRISQSRLQEAYSTIYAVNKVAPIAKSTIKLFSFFVRKYLTKVFMQERPDKIVVLHFLLIKPVEDILKEFELNIPVVTIVTDPYTGHRMWFSGNNCQYILFSNRMKKMAIDKGVSAKRIQVFPFILKKEFSHQLSPLRKMYIKKKLGFNLNKKLILLLGGGDGLPNAKKISKSIHEMNLEAELAIVCGKNEKLKNEMLKLNDDISIKVFGFIDFVYDLINISDIVITKGGPSSILEILIQGKIPIITSYIWEQEKGNVDFVVDNCVGFYVPRLRKLPLVVKNIIDDKKLINKLNNKIKNLRLKNGTSEVSKYIYKYKL